jgi:phosphoserine phosphatase RsbU/P
MRHEGDIVNLLTSKIAEIDRHAQILIADDDDVSRRILGAILEKAGYKVAYAVDGEDCLEKIKQNIPRILLLDWVMPKMDGIDVCRAIQSDPLLQSIYIILVTSRQGTANKVLALDEGADDFLSKPIEPEELLARIRVGHRIKSLNRELALALDEVKMDLSAASAVQRELLPARAAEFAPLTFSWEFRPTTTMAGDLFDVFRVDEKHVALYLLDVSGHGVAPAMLSVLLHHCISHSPMEDSLIKDHLKEPPYYRLCPPGEVARRLNQRFPAETNGLYFTIFYATFNIQTLEMSYCRAGHVPPIILRGGKACRLENGDLPIGMFPDAEFSSYTFQFELGDRMLICSDAVMEAANGDDEFFGSTRVEQTLLDQMKNPLNEAIGVLIERVQQWQGRHQFQDDFSALMMEVRK